MIEHLAVSTAVLAVAMAAARFLPLTARTRYALLCCGLAKFAVPTAVFGLVPAEAVPSQLRVFGGGAAAPAVQAAADIQWLPIVWAAVAALLLGRWLLLRKRTIEAALRSPAPPSARELAAMRAANVAAGLVRSPLCEAPAVLRVIRPVIVLPAGGCDDLDEDELRSLLLHERAHIARHDNLASVAQAVATSLLWFHPLVWSASRAISAAREEACDEAVADEMRETDAYVSALDKLCHAIASPRTAGASCMAGSHVKERMQHLMSYESIKQNAWSHRTLLTIAILGIALSTVAATRGAAIGQPYKLHYTVTDEGTNELVFRVQVQQGDRFHLQRDIRTSPGEPSTLRYGMDDGRHITEFVIKALGTPEKGALEFEVQENGKLVQQQTLTYDNTTRKRRGNGDSNISLELDDAKLHEVMNTFSQLTGYDVVIEEGLEAAISVTAENVTWEELLETIARDHGLRITVQGRTIRVEKR